MPVPLAPHSMNIKPDASKPAVAKKQEVATTQAVKSKKEAAQLPKPPPAPESKPHSPSHLKKMSRRSSKPIINWFQRKWSGTVRSRRVSETDSLRGQRLGARSPNVKDKHRRSSVPMPPIVTAPTRSKSKNVGSSKRNTISLNDPESEASGTDSYTTDSEGDLRSSVRDSTWSPISNYRDEADEDASVRPLPPSSPPSPAPSQSTSSYLSDPRTFRSVTASTKPTTVLSVDLGTGGMAHIAQAPPTPTTPGHRIPLHVRTHSTGPGSGGSITFSAIPPPSPTSRPGSGASNNGRGGLQAPLHTAHHPRNNPRPSSPPQDDASVLTLASSAFMMPGLRYGMAQALSGRASLADDSLSHFSHGARDSTSHFLLGELDDERERYHDLDHDVEASVRALRPRSSRRGSWESEVSRWSASASLALTGTAGGLSFTGTRERSLWTTGSYRTGGISLYTEDQDREEDESEQGAAHEHHKYPSDEMSVLLPPSAEAAEDASTAAVFAPSVAEELDTPPGTVLSSETELASTASELSAESLPHGSSTPNTHVAGTPKAVTLSLEPDGEPNSLRTGEDVSTLGEEASAVTALEESA